MIDSTGNIQLQSTAFTSNMSKKFLYDKVLFVYTCGPSLTNSKLMQYFTL